VLGPIGASLAGEWRDRRLALIGTGALEYVPLTALPLPRASGSADWLVDRHELVRIPSASVLALLRQERRAPSTSPRPVVVVADAVYSKDDPRVTQRPALARRTTATPAKTMASAAATPRPIAGDLRRGMDSSSTRADFGRLAFSRDEASSIERLASRGTVTTALDFSASVETMMGPQVAQARIVHIASHGVFNSVRPELSGLVLSLVDTRGEPTDGVLHLYDIFNLHLSADLVVLSACETGLGREMTGEGLIGLTRAFMYAGAPRIVASLWQVDDVATAALMRAFYEGLLVRQQTPAAALAAAQRKMRADPRWRSPYYWAGFTLVGDWR
jgi:CHAT domain-containing protein